MPLLLSVCGITQSCSEGIDIFSVAPPTPIIYCFLNPDDSVQYLRLSKTFTIPVDNPNHKPSADELIYSEEPEIYLEADGSGIKQRFYRCEQINSIQKDKIEKSIADVTNSLSTYNNCIEVTSNTLTQFKKVAFNLRTSIESIIKEPTI